ncbi:class I SAM-dependent rRNA methyltransferase [Staphylococcus sp. SQ8-PEA]|uniref:Class I SAM-dependent rRNA methyltransferase n=1 Tax=Staphylococcus marylandisciuri TaxID=2981529 RepID=A0ABT2QNT6_9STAP|nr:class I SAM-dependent rRNA methyltransferase [Staphylococcus marylandisciuri]MCU5745629.1 class I SAM-dependent rRNA methyltransferase [Staphylococcus marylandisciuri]
MKKAVLNRGKETKYLNHYPLVEENDLYDYDHLKEGELFQIVDHRNKYVGTAYVGFQHKGIGWIISYDAQVNIDASFFETLFLQAKAEREYFYNIDGTNAFRLFNAEGDGIGGLTIDNYNGHLLIQWYSKGIYKFRYLILQAMRNVFQFTSIYEKMRFSNHPYEGGFVEGREPEFPIVIEENFTFYNINLDDGMMTGLFLDQKEVRKKLRDQFVDGRDVLNLFSYTGAFSVVSAKRANSTTSVDLANRSRELTEENFGVNGIDPQTQYIYVMDTFDYFKYAKRHHISYDTIVIDPPSFARNKKKTFSVLKDYDKLISNALDIIRPDGNLLLCTNHSEFTKKQFKKVIQATLAQHNRAYEIVEVMGLPKDFKTHPHYKPSKYLKAIFIQLK